MNEMFQYDKRITFCLAESAIYVIIKVVIQLMVWK